MIDVVEYLRKLLENIDTIYFTLDKVTPNGRRFYSFFIITNNEIKRISGYIAHATGTTKHSKTMAVKCNCGADELITYTLSMILFNDFGRLKVKQI